MSGWIRKSTSEQWQDKTTLKRNGKCIHKLCKKLLLVLIWIHHKKLIFYSPIFVTNNLLLKIYCENIVVAFLNYDFLFFILFFISFTHTVFFSFFFSSTHVYQCTSKLPLFLNTKNYIIIILMNLIVYILFECL